MKLSDITSKITTTPTKWKAVNIGIYTALAILPLAGITIPAVMIYKKKKAKP